MQNCYKLGLAALAASISLVGCGGGSSSSTTTSPETVTGQFVDAPVSGLNYECAPSGNKDVTNDNGEYTCNLGDTVTFSLGAYVLGTATASSGIVTPYDIQDDENTSINVARLLQSLDTNDSDSIITIPDNFTALDDSTAELNATFSDFETQIIEDLNDTEITDLIGSDAAQENMDNGILYSLVTGKTLYLADYDFVDEMVFNSDVSLITWTEVTPGAVNPENGIFETIIDAGYLIITTDEGTKALTLSEQTDTYIEFDVLGEDSVRFYYAQADAEAYYDSLNIVRNFYVGNTIYFGTEEGITGYRTYEVDGTYTGSITSADGTTTFAVSGTYIIDDNDIGIYRETPSSATIVLLYVGEEAEGLAFTASGVAAAGFQTEAERDAYVAGDTIEITEAMLNGKTFYHYEEDTNYDNVVLETIHATMTLSANTLARTEFIEVYEGGVVVDSFTDSFTVPYEIIDGKIRIDVPAMDGDPAAYIWWTLTSEDTDSWTLIDQEDENKDGSIEYTDNVTLYLSEPTWWPAP